MIMIIFSFFIEIARVRASLFQINGVRKEPLQLPEPDGETVTLNEKVYVPVKEHPDVSSNLFLKLFLNFSVKCRLSQIKICKSADIKKIYLILFSNFNEK